MPEFSPRRTGDIGSPTEDLATLAQSISSSPLVELGATGLKRASGYVDEEFLPQLRGRKAVQVYKEMSENDPLVGALIFTIDRLLRNVEWTVKPSGAGQDASKAAKFVESCMDDMSHTWSDFISEALSCLVYGWSWHEIVYKKRVGPWQKNPQTISKHTDGLIGWRKMPIRAQETLLRWSFDDSGDVRAMIQMAPPRYQTVAIPMERSLLFRYRHHKGNPEGVSMLRNSYRPWYMKKRLEEFEAVGIERDLAGMPIVKVPAEFLRAKPGSDQAKTIDSFKKMVKSVRRNEQEGVVFPMAYDQDTKQPLYSFELLGGGGGRAFNTDSIIQRYEQRILMTVLADFIMVGHQSTGSYSLHTDKTGIFRTSLNSIAKMIADTLNRHALPKLFSVNGWKVESLPEITPTNVDSPDIGQLAQFMSSMSSLGLQWFPNAEMENFVRDAAKLPLLDDGQMERRRQLEMQSEATSYAQASTEYLQARQGLAMAQNPQAAQQMPQAGAQQQAQPQEAQ